MALTARVQAWRERGAGEQVAGHRIHVFRREGAGPLLLLLHGFPSSSYDWRLILDELPGWAVLAFDCLGFGLSDKPRDHTYTLGEQADIAEELVGRHWDGPVFFVAHDMGTSVATELMARDMDGELRMDLVGGVLFNGSMIQGAASPTLGQKLLRGPLGPLAARLSSERFFRAQFGSIFSPGHPAPVAWLPRRYTDALRPGRRLLLSVGAGSFFASWQGFPSRRREDLLSTDEEEVGVARDTDHRGGPREAQAGARAPGDHEAA